MTELAWILQGIEKIAVLAIAIIGFFLRRLIKAHDETAEKVQGNLKEILKEVRLTNGRVIALEVWKNMHTHDNIEKDIRDLRQHHKGHE